MPNDNFDLVVIGTGTAASTAASECRRAGWRVAVIDQLPFGGTCALRGCDPKKVLVGAAEACDHARRMQGRGLGGEPVIRWPELIGFKRTFTEPVPQRREQDFAADGIATFHGHARFRDPQSVEVDGRLLEGRFFLIAAGAAPIRLGIPGEEHLASSTDFLELDTLPKRIALVGGGYIASEFSHIAARAGAQVTILQRGERLLTGFDPQLVQWLTEKSRRIGIDIRLCARVEKIERLAATSSRGGSYRVDFAIRDGRSSVEADLVVHAAGRAPDLASLDLDAGRIEREGRRLKLNEFLQSTSNPAVYAAGDSAASGPPLTPVAEYDGGIAAANMLEGNRQKPDYLGVPSVVYTIPALARVGLLEAEARERRLRFRVRHEETSTWYTARRVGEDCAGFKVLIEEGTERILGAHLLGPQAEEVINLFALAIRAGLSASQLKRIIAAYPTASSDVQYML